jgi:hypothetical protein
MKHKTPSPSTMFSVKRTAFFSFVKYTGVALVFAGLLFLVAVCIIYPLWFLATQSREIYSTVIAFSLSPLLLLFFLRARRAFRNGVFAEFLAKISSVLAFILFVCGQVLWAVMQIFLYTLVRSDQAVAGGIIFLVLTTSWGGFGFPALIVFFRRLKIAGQAFSVIAWILFLLQFLYWMAVFVYHGFFWHPIGFILSFSLFLFLEKITKIRRGKKNPAHEAFHH